MPGNCSFNDVWLHKPVFKEWLRRVEGQQRKARCNACSKEFDIGNMGEAALTSHMDGKKTQTVDGHKKKINPAVLMDSS